MNTIIKAQKILAEAPGEALSDALGIVAVAMLIFGGFTIPAFL